MYNLKKYKNVSKIKFNNLVCCNSEEMGNGKLWQPPFKPFEYNIIIYIQLEHDALNFGFNFCFQNMIFTKLIPFDII